MLSELLPRISYYYSLRQPIDGVVKARIGDVQSAGQLIRKVNKHKYFRQNINGRNTGRVLPAKANKEKQLTTMARVRKQQPKGRIITTRRRSYRNRAGAELVEPEGMTERSTVVTRRMSMVREHARRQRLENQTRNRNQKKTKTTGLIDAEQLFFKCTLCTGTLKRGMTGFVNHLVEIHYVNPKRYVLHILEKNAIFKEVASDDPKMTENELVIGTLVCEEFQRLKDAMLDDKNRTLLCAKARYNLMVERKNEERQKIGTEIATIFVASEEEAGRTDEQQVEQRSVLSWASKFIQKTKGRQWWLEKLPVKGLIDFEGDKENLLKLAEELTTVAVHPRGEELRIDEMLFWYKCKLCIYSGRTGDLYRGSELFAQHIVHDHKISITFYVNKFIRNQEIYMEHFCNKENCGHAGSIQEMNAMEEHP